MGDCTCLWRVEILNTLKILDSLSLCGRLSYTLGLWACSTVELTGLLPCRALACGIASFDVASDVNVEFVLAFPVNDL